MLGHVEYLAPSPLTYSELVWMPAMVAAQTARGRRVGYWVARMYVDCERSLAAGRTEWALPKSLARFDYSGAGVRIQAEDGTRISIAGVASTRREPISRWSLPRRNRMATLQVRDGRIVRFRADLSARVKPERMTIGEFSTRHGAWSGFDGAKRAPRAASMEFQSTMKSPEPLE